MRPSEVHLTYSVIIEAMLKRDDGPKCVLGGKKFGQTRYDLGHVML